MCVGGGEEGWGEGEQEAHSSAEQVTAASQNAAAFKDLLKKKDF